MVVNKLSVRRLSVRGNDMVSRDHVVFLILPLQAPKPIKLKETSIPAISPNTSPHTASEMAMERPLLCATR